MFKNSKWMICGRPFGYFSELWKHSFYVTRFKCTYPPFGPSLSGQLGYFVRSLNNLIVFPTRSADLPLSFLGNPRDRKDILLNRLLLLCKWGFHYLQQVLRARHLRYFLPMHLVLNSFAVSQYCEEANTGP